MIVKLLTELHLECLSLTGGFTGLSEATLVKMPHCWKSYVTAHFTFVHLHLKIHCIIHGGSKIESEYDQEIPQSQTADNPVAPRGKAAQPSRDTRKTN